MKKSGTKRTLLLSICSIVLCLAMLVGTTFAWFTSSASTEISGIETGILKIDIQDKDNNSVNGKTLNFIPQDGRTTTILWEPNCTYVLPEIKLVNTGSLALKCKLEVSAPTKDEGKLLEVIDFTYTIDGAAFDFSQEITLLPGESTSLISISAHMQETAGNEYQNRKLEGIVLTASATQVPYEVDSYTDQYDANLIYPVLDGKTVAQIAAITPGSAETVTVDGIEFYVLAKQNGQALLLTKDCVATMPFSAGHATTLWRDCDVRTWLNDTWLPSYSELNAAAVETTLYSVNSSATNPEFIATQDRAFLLSEADINDTYHCYMNGGDGKPITNADYYTAGAILPAPGGSWDTAANDYWWTRSGNCWGDGLPLVSFWDRDDHEVHAQYPGLEIISVRPVLWVDYEVHQAKPVEATTAEDFSNALKETGSVSVAEDLTITGSTLMTQPEVTIVGDGTTVTASSLNKQGIIRFAPESEEDAFFDANDVFTVNLEGVTISNQQGSRSSSIVLGNCASVIVNEETHEGLYGENKTLNVNGGTFIAGCASGNGAIYVTAMKNCTINITGATFRAEYTKAGGSTLGSFVALDVYTYNDSPRYQDRPETAVYNTTVNFINCTFLDPNGNEITDMTQSELLYGFDSARGNSYNIINN